METKNCQNLLDFSAEIKDENGSIFNFLLFFKEENFFIRLSQPLNPLYWENSFNLDSLGSEDKTWNFFISQNEVSECIIESIKENSYFIKKSHDDDYTFRFNVSKKKSYSFFDFKRKKRGFGKKF